MITILLGGDTLSKDKYIFEYISKKNLSIRKIRPGDILPDMDSLSATALFGGKEVFIFENCWKDLEPEKLQASHSESDAEIIIIEDSIDQRKTINKEIVKDKRILVKSFEVPFGNTASKWIAKHADELGIKMDLQAANALAHALAPDDKAKLDVLLAHNEMLKLRSYANKDSISSDMVEEMVTSKLTIDVFALLDAVGLKNKSNALQLLENFFENTIGDEKTKAIQFGALLADQLRNVLLVLDAAHKNLPEELILEKTGWKSNRLFVMKKIARNYNPKQIRLTLAKLESLDIELKSSMMPPLVILDMIISQM